MRVPSVLPAILSAVLAMSFTAFAADESPAILVVHNKQFEPNKLLIPAGIKTKIIVRNQDAMPAEFESYDLSREVVVPGHGEVTIFVGPLEPGTYQFFNDFNHDMQGTITVNPAVRKGN